MYSHNKSCGQILNKSKLVKIIQVIIALLIGVGCLYLVIEKFNWEQIWLVTKKVNHLNFLAFEGLIICLYNFLRTLRWRILLHNENLKIPLRKLYLYNSIAIGISTITPFQSGEALKVELIRKYGSRRLSGYAVFFLERIFDLLTVLGFAVAGTAFGFDLGIKPFYLYLAGGLLIFGLAVAITAIFLLPLKIFQPLKVWIDETRKRKKSLSAAFVLTVLAWTTVILGWQFAFAFFGIDINFLQSITVVTITTLIAIISFVPGAVGVSELSILTILSGMGIEPSLAQIGAIAIRAYALVILLISLLHWIFLKICYKNNSGMTE
jgi:uncharacterized membrane protein YbhN (UPF0104 family)